MKKYVFFAFKGDPMCLIHVMLNTIDLNERGIEAKIVLEGEAVKLVKMLTEAENPLFKKIKESGFIDCICKACSAKMGVLEYNSSCGIPLNQDMAGHPAMSKYIEEDFTIITL